LNSSNQIKLPEAFAALFAPYRYKVFYGGRGAAKSRSFATALIVSAFTEKERILCAREIQLSINESVKRVLDDEINRLGLSSYFLSTKTEIRCITTGSLILFAGLRDNPDKIKSMEGVTKCWIEEAHSVSQESLDILIPTIREENSEIWFSFNPKFENDPVYKMFVTSQPPESYVQKVNYDDNPFFPEVLRKEMEWCRHHDIDKYRHVWEGEPVIHSAEQIFNGVWCVENFETSKETVFYYGSDFGFSQDPTTLIRCWIDGKTLYIDYEAYGIGVELNEIPQLYRSVPGADIWRITADSARPDTISYLKKKGFNIAGAQKGKGSIEDGIEFIRSFDVKIHPRCKNTIDEFMTYSYKTDKHTGEILPIIVDKKNHCVDALRYALEKRMKNSTVFIA
jgi:phage terminase large subunit